MKRDRFDQLTENFLEVLAEVVEAWCPAVEAAWRTAIREMKDELEKCGKMDPFDSDPPAGT